MDQLNSQLETVRGDLTSSVCFPKSLKSPPFFLFLIFVFTCSALFLSLSVLTCIEQQADIESLRKQLEAAREESTKMREFYMNKIAEQHKAAEQARKACEKLEKQNAELKKRLQTMNGDSVDSATAKSSEAAPPPLPPSLPSFGGVPTIRGRTGSISEGRHTRKMSELSAKGSSALSQFTFQP